MASTIWSGDKIKALLPALGLGDNATIRSGTVNVQSVATAGVRGDLYIKTGATPTIYQKITTDGTDTNWALVPASLGSLTASSVVVTDTLGNIKTDPELTYDSTTNNLVVGGTVTASNLSGSSSGTNTGDITLTAVGSSPSANGASLSGQALTLQPADATHPGVITTGSQTIAGSKTLSGLLNADGGIDRSTAGTLTIGATNSTTINIGNAGATVNIQGTTIYENTPLLQVADPLITVNHGGGAGSGQNAGIEVEENSIITGYAETSSDRNSWIFKAPNTAGIVTVTPGSGGFTIDQGSHNPVTIGTANGLSLSTQVLSLQLSTTSLTGALSSTDWNTFNNKQPAGNYITALTGDITASGPGSAAATLATVNSNVGSFGTATQTSTFTVNGKGLITAASNTSIQIAESQVTNLVSDLAGKQATGNYITALTGDATATGPGSVALTLATVNSNVGTFASVTVNGKGLVTAAANLTGDATTSGGALTLATVNGNVGSFGSSTSIPSFTVNAKGLITAASGNVVIAPAGTLSGTTLNATVVSSSLTSVGTITTGVWNGTTIAVANGGTGVTSVTTSPTTTSFAGWDASANLSADSFIAGYATTATAAGTTTLTVDSKQQQYFTGSTTQTVTLPVTSTLVLGQSYIVTNNSTGIVTVQSSGANTILAQTTGGSAIYTVILTSGTTAASWNVTNLSAGATVTPTVQKFTSSSGTYTTPANCSYIRVLMVGGGGGGGGGGNSGATGVTGGTTSFGTSLLTANGGVGGTGGTGGSSGGAGGSASLGSGPIGTALSGGYGSGSGAGFEAGMGGSTALGGAGGTAYNAVGGTGVANTGGGGGGGGNTAGGSSGGGGGGGYVNAFIIGPATTYAYTVAIGGTGGAAGTLGQNGGPGGTGYIVIEEYYLNASLGNGGAVAPTVSTALVSGSATGTGGFVSGTYTTPANVTRLEIEMVGGGSGGAGGGTGGGNGGAGGNTTFGSSLLTANGGSASVFETTPAAGGTASVTTSGSVLQVAAISGGDGSSWAYNGTGTAVGVGAGSGGNSFFGGAGGGGSQSTGAASAAKANSGSGGGGGAGEYSLTNGATGQSGAAGGYVKAIIIPTAGQTFSYNVGAAGTAGAAGTSGGAGGAGGLGGIWVTEYYSNGAIGTATNVTGIVTATHGGTGNTTGYRNARAVIANRGSTQSISNATQTIVDYNTVVKDPDSTVTTGASWHSTIAETGYYWIYAHVMWDSASWTAGNSLSIYIFLNGAEVNRSFNTVQVNYSGYRTEHVGALRYLTAGDTIAAALYQDTGGSRSLIGSSEDNYINIYKVGD